MFLRQDDVPKDEDLHQNVLIILPTVLQQEGMVKDGDLYQNVYNYTVNVRSAGRRGEGRRLAPERV